MPAGNAGGFRFCAFVSLEKKVSLLTELGFEPKLFSTKMPPLRGWGRIFHSTESRAGKRREIGNLCPPLKINGNILFYPKNKSAPPQRLKLKLKLKLRLKLRPKAAPAK
ncbi:MAG: hypothetical protein D6714_10235, partial [Bacteroidetes bacterium]